MDRPNGTDSEYLFAGTNSKIDLTDKGIKLDWLVSIPLTIVPSHWAYSGEHRLDGSYYSQEAVAAQRIVNDCGFEAVDLRDLVSELYILGRFKRVYATNKESAYPYLSASDAMNFRPSTNEWLAKSQLPKQADAHFAKKNWLLISSSGTVGRLILVTERLEKYFLTHDLIRVVPSEHLPIGYLYAFLSTWMGQALVVKDQYGSAVKHLEPHHVADIPIPLLPAIEQNSIHDNILKAYALRDAANNLLDQADEILHRELGIPFFDEGVVPYLGAETLDDRKEPKQPHPKAFSIMASELYERFDASYHVPTAHLAVKQLSKGKYQIERLVNISEDIVVSPRFKRIYVPREYGIPLLQGSHLPQLRPQALKYISRTQQKNLKNWIIQKGWVLITCSGTIGRIGVVSSYRDQWAASQHLLRIIPNYATGHPGYIAAFLMSPYGQHQILAKTYGGVVDEITSEDTGQIWIPNAPLRIQQKIGDLVIQAFELKDEASSIEETTISNLEHRLAKSAIQNP